MTGTRENSRSFASTSWPSMSGRPRSSSTASGARDARQPQRLVAPLGAQRGIAGGRQRRRQKPVDLRFVVHDQDGAEASRSCRRDLHRNHRTRRAVGRQIGARAARRDAPAHRLDKGLGDSKAKPGAWVRSGRPASPEKNCRTHAAGLRPGMPTPSSATESSTWSPARSAATVIRPPPGVYFTALSSRFTSTCSSSAGSAIAELALVEMFRPAMAAPGTRATAASITSASCTRSRRGLISPVSTRAISMMLERNLVIRSVSWVMLSSKSIAGALVAERLAGRGARFQQRRESR